MPVKIFGSIKSSFIYLTIPKIRALRENFQRFFRNFDLNHRVKCLIIRENKGQRKLYFRIFYAANVVKWWLLFHKRQIVQQFNSYNSSTLDCFYISSPHLHMKRTTEADHSRIFYNICAVFSNVFKEMWLKLFDLIKVILNLTFEIYDVTRNLFSLAIMQHTFQWSHSGGLRR